MPESLRRSSSTCARRSSICASSCLRPLEQRRRELAADLRRERPQQPSRVVAPRVHREPHAQPELGVVLEQGVGPRRPAALRRSCATASSAGSRRRSRSSPSRSRSMVRSPKSCDRSFRYGVSPQPAHAPENSNRGSSSWLPFTSRCTSLAVDGRHRARGTRSARARSASGRSASTMSIALCRGLVLSFAGQNATHRPHPVQSSGATCTTYVCPACSLALYVVETKPAGARSRCAGSNTTVRSAACGQMSAHLLHWMQMAGSHDGSSSAVLRFSHSAVPVGQVPSTGKALTGNASPRPATITAVTASHEGAARGRPRSARARRAAPRRGDLLRAGAPPPCAARRGRRRRSCA